MTKDRKIHHVVIIVVVAKEIRPIVDQFQLKECLETTAKFDGLARAKRGKIGQLEVTCLRVAESAIFQKHNSGYSQVSAIAALIRKEIDPDLVISYGSAGGVKELGIEIGDVVCPTSAIFMDRLRCRNQNAFYWGLYGGVPVPCPNILSKFELASGPVGSKIGYVVNPIQEKIMDKLGVVCLDMESASICQILNQTEVPLLILKVVTNGVYPHDTPRMEMEYKENISDASSEGAKTLSKILHFIENRRLSEL